jgi:hypothetical protein
MSMLYSQTQAAGGLIALFVTHSLASDLAAGLLGVCLPDWSDLLLRGLLRVG